MQQLQHWVNHVDYTMYSNMLHNNSVQIKRLSDDGKSGVSGLLTKLAGATKMKLQESLWSVTSGHILLWAPALCNCFNTFFWLLCSLQSILFVPISKNQQANGGKGNSTSADTITFWITMVQQRFLSVFYLLSTVYFCASVWVGSARTTAGNAYALQATFCIRATPVC